MAFLIENMIQEHLSNTLFITIHDIIATAGYILSAFLFLYAIEAGYFAGLLFASKRIRGQTFRGG